MSASNPPSPVKKPSSQGEQGKLNRVCVQWCGCVQKRKFISSVDQDTCE